MDDTLIQLEKLISKKDIDALKNIVIFRDDDGTYNLYDRYLINKNQDGLYVVSVIGTHTEKNFYKLKHAVAWCSFDKRDLFKGAKRLHQLDQMIFSMDTEIQIHSKLLKNAKDTDYKIIYLSKLSQDKAKKRKFSDELNRYLVEYKTWQTNMFDTKPKY